MIRYIERQGVADGRAQKQAAEALRPHEPESRAAAAAEFTAEPLPLPWCAYPGAQDTARHGLQPLPEALPVADFARAWPHRSRLHSTIPAACLTLAQVLEMTRMVAASFARREPQCRHLRPPRSLPEALAEAQHKDPFGSEGFGAWNSETLLYWIIRLMLLTDPASPRYAVRLNREALTLSLAITGREGRILGGAFNETLLPGGTPPLRRDDPFLEAALAYAEPIIEMLGAQNAEALEALCEQYPAFQEACYAGKVGHHFMVARSDMLPKEDAFELVAASAAHFAALGYTFMVVEATNPWTGAACETLNGTRVHFAPFRTRRVVRPSEEPLEGAVSSPDGFLSYKDSGSMFYVIRLA